MFLVNNSYLKKYLDIITRTYYKNVRVTSEYYNFRCPICGDSKKNKKKKRGYILTKKTPWVYKCHNCGVSMSIEKWMKQYHPTYYSDYIKELLHDQSEIKKEQEQEILTNKSHELNEKLEELREKKKKEHELTKNFISILKGDGYLFAKAIDFCNNRRIPKEIWHKWYVDPSGDYKGRLIIPFYDNNNMIYYFQARTLVGHTLKYINMRENREDAIYNWYNIDTSKPVVMTEGPIDSMFIENAVATCGTHFSEEVQKKLNSVDTYYLLDPDLPGRERAYELMSEGKDVFLWSLFARTYNLPFKEKWDINDLVIYANLKNKIKFQNLQRFFSNNIFDSVYL